MAYSVDFLLFFGGVFAVFPANAGSCPSALDDPDAGRIFFYRLYNKIPPLVYYYPLNPGSRSPAINRLLGMVGVLFPADSDSLPVSLREHYTSAGFGNGGVGLRAQQRTGNNERAKPNNKRFRGYLI